ncbi:hypothetical protein QW180_15850 [Vibrio sinaloensis]|nr:hypothetical protein [Vibrio sinaloensis]
MAAVAAAAGYGYVTQQVTRYVSQPLQLEQPEIFLLYRRALASTQCWLR